MKESGKKLNRHVLLLQLTVLLLLLALIAGAVSWAWLSHERLVAGIAIIDAPQVLYINAGHKEALTYLDMSGINLEDPVKYKDYVFAVSGEYLSSFKLQLAYTTNNQFSFEIFPANEGGDSSGSDASLTYTAHTGAASEPTYTYYFNTSNKVAMTFLNKDDNASEILAKKNDSYANDTYGSAYDANKYAYPLYEQSTTAGNNDTYLAGNSAGDFLKYFVIRVHWPSNRTNDRETDILYISAKGN